MLGKNRSSFDTRSQGGNKKQIPTVLISPLGLLTTVVNLEGAMRHTTLKGLLSTQIQAASPCLSYHLSSGGLVEDAHTQCTHSTHSVMQHANMVEQNQSAKKAGVYELKYLLLRICPYALTQSQNMSTQPNTTT